MPISAVASALASAAASATASALALAAMGVVTVGCTAAPAVTSVHAAAPAMTVSRWLLTWHRPVPDEAAALEAWEAEASALAGLPVRRVAAVSGTMVAVTLACEGEAACARARSRLLADPRVRDLVPDARRRPASP